MSLLDLIFSYTTTPRPHHVARTVPATRVVTVAGYDGDMHQLRMENGEPLQERFTCDANTTFELFQTKIQCTFGIHPKAQRFENLLTKSPTCEKRSHLNTPAKEKMFTILAADGGDKVIQVYQQKQEYATSQSRCYTLGSPVYIVAQTRPIHDLGDGTSMLPVETSMLLRDRDGRPQYDYASGAPDCAVAAWT